jgi:hypothetical protein
LIEFFIFVFIIIFLIENKRLWKNWYKRIK